MFCQCVYSFFIVLKLFFLVYFVIKSTLAILSLLFRLECGMTDHLDEILLFLYSRCREG